MSNVLARKRSISNMEFYHSADDLRNTLTRALMNENTVPKRWRPVFTFPIIEMVKDLFGHMIAANNTYPYTAEALAERKRMQLYAINDCERIDDMLQYLLTTVYYGRIDADHPMPAEIERAGDLVGRTETLLKAWRKSAKIVNYKVQK